MPDNLPVHRPNQGLATPEPRAHTQQNEWADMLAIIDQLSERLHEVESHTLPAPFAPQSQSKPKKPSLVTRLWYQVKIGLYRATFNTRGALKYRHKLAALNLPIGDTEQIGILSPPHTRFVAEAIARLITEAGLQAVMIEPDWHPVFFNKLYIVLCPQVFTRLPPGDKMVVYQFEQCQAERWQQESYLKLLRSARAVLDYSTDNLRQLSKRGIEYPKTFHVAVQAQQIEEVNMVGAGNVQGDDQAPIEVLFYGAIHNPRRRRILAELAQHLPIRIETDLFGEALHALLRRTRVVLNIHFYDEAMLETTRIHECLSFGVEVVSEISADQVEHQHLSDAVSFVELGDVPAMVRAIRERLARPRLDLRAFVSESDNRFRYQFGRFMLAQQLIDEKTFQKLTRDWQIPSDTICLTLPESIDRHQVIRHNAPLNACIFEGIRQPLGWQGCALSYKYLCSKALEKDLADLLIFEDDAVLTAETEDRLKRIRSILAGQRHKWDIFAALIADLHPDTRVLDVENHHGQVLVTIDRMTSMVCNIYGRRAMEIISRWRLSNMNTQRNTIDRYLEKYSGLRIVTTLPFLAGHRSESHSTLWGIHNSQYDPIIAASQQRLQDKVDEFMRNKATRTSRTLHG